MVDFRRFGLAYLGLAALNIILLALGLATVGLYAVDVQRAHERGVPIDSKWAYAVAVGAIAAVTALALLVPLVLRFAHVVAAWNFVVFVLYIAAFGIFGRMYINENPEGVEGIKRMKNAVWVLLTSALLWLIYAVIAAVYWFLHRDRKSRFTGRARV